MLTELMIRQGRAAKQAKWNIRDRISLLTDVHSENCKNYFQNVIVFEKDGLQCAVQKKMAGELREKNKFFINKNETPSLPVIYPHGGNRLKAQGIYPIPCYLLYDQHIKSMKDANFFTTNYLFPRLNRTFPFMNKEDAYKKTLAEAVSNVLSQQSGNWITDDKQLGILMIVDYRFPLFQRSREQLKDDRWLWVGQSMIYEDNHIYLDGNIALGSIVEAKFQEAASLGQEENAVSTFTNQESKRVVSVYNKSWLWLSPTWDLPKSIYWKDNQWTKGIKIDQTSYEAFLYGTQLIKRMTTRIRSSILKEMFAPVQNAEAKKHMGWNSFDDLFGVPLILPLLKETGSSKLFEVHEQLMRKNDDVQSDNDLNFEVLAGIDRKVTRWNKDEWDKNRLTLLYYSGDLSRGSMHIRAVIEDVVPSVAKQVQDLVERLGRVVVPEYQKIFGIQLETFYETKTLPALLGNAYGPGYFWQSLQKTLHRQDLTLDRMSKSIAMKLNELANKRDFWLMKKELLFYFCFLFFYREYALTIQDRKKDVKLVNDWQELLFLYQKGELSENDLLTPDKLGFVSGLMVRQFENSYHRKTGNSFLEHRVMKFGSRLTPMMIWENGILRAFELHKQWELNLADHYFKGIPAVTVGFNTLLDGDKSRNRIIEQSDFFMNMFWAGYHMYKNPKKQESNEMEA